MSEKKDKKIIFRLDNELAEDFKLICLVLKSSQQQVCESLVKNFIDFNKSVIEKLKDK